MGLIFVGEGILRGRVENTHFERLDLLERALKRPIKVPVHEVTGKCYIFAIRQFIIVRKLALTLIKGMRKPEDNYGAFISMTPGQPY